MFTAELRSRMPLTTSQQLHSTALNILTQRLTDRGNELSLEHRDALSKMLRAFAQLSMGEKQGRWAIPLAASLGKSQGIVSFIIAAHHLLDRLPSSFSLTVCASKVEDLAEMYRACKEAGVPESELGLAYSNRFTYDEDKARAYLSGKETSLPEGYSSEPASRDLESRRFIFVTHARASMKSKGKREASHRHIAALTLYNGQRRHLTLWDETFLRSAPWATTLMSLSDIANLVRGRLKYSDELQDLAKYLTECEERIEQGIASGGVNGFTVDLPVLTPVDRERMIRQLPFNLGMRDHIESFLVASAYSIRVAQQNDGRGALYNYELRVPQELDPIVVLDASSRIRYISMKDSTLQMWPGIPLDIKKYPDLDVYLLAQNTGRHTVDKDLTYPSRSLLLKELVHTIQTTQDEDLRAGRSPGKFLVITFTEDKKNTRGKEGIPTKIRTALTAAGIAASRYSILTYGSETATSRYKDHPNVYFVGQLHLPTEVLRGQIAGQQDQLDAKIPAAELEAAQLGEHAHSNYQGLNRGTSRIVKNGIAAPSKVWIAHKHPRKLRLLLEEMLPAARWHEWQPTYLVPVKSTECVHVFAEDVAGVIVEYLRSRSTDVATVSSRDAKDYVEAQFGGPIFDKTYRSGRLAAEKIVADSWTFGTVAKQSFTRRKEDA